MPDNLTVGSFTDPNGVVANNTSLPAKFGNCVNGVPQEEAPQNTIQDRLDRIERLLSASLRRVQWEDKVSETGIQLAGGPTTVTRKGHIVTATIIQTGATNAAIMLLVQEETANKFYVLAPDQVKPTD